MLTPVKLQKVYLIGMRSVQAEALRLWQKLGVIHISPIEAMQGLQEGQPLENYSEISTQLIRIRAILAQLPKVPSEPQPISQPLLEAARSIAIEDDLRMLETEEKETQSQLEGIRERERQLARLEHIPLKPASLTPHLSYHLVCVPCKKAQAIMARIRKNIKHVQMMAAPDGLDSSRTLILIASPKSADVLAAIEGLEQVPWPSSLSLTPKAALLAVRSEKEALEEKLRAIARKRMKLSLKYYNVCKKIEEGLSMLADLSRISSSYMRQSSSCFFSQGWVHPRNLLRLQTETAKAFGNKVMVHLVPEDAHHGIGRPTLLENPKVASPLQFLVEFLSLPRADEIDPTMITFFTIPILYGLIVGDAGYAALSFLIAALLRKKASKGSMLGHIAGLWMIGAVPSFVFGIIFDEYFGYSHAAIIGTRLYEGLVHRVEDVSGLLLLTIIVGWLHIALGFLLGAINEWHHEKKHAIAKLAWLPIQIGGTIAVASFLLNALSIEAGIAGIAMLAFGAIVLAWSEGPLGLVEIPGLASNIMSYARIAAVGVAGVILAEAINTLIKPNPSLLSSPAGILLFIFVAIAYAMAHAFNAFVAMFEGLIHGARLNVVEFFGKFFHGGGIPFKPLSENIRIEM